MNCFDRVFFLININCIQFICSISVAQLNVKKGNLLSLFIKDTNFCFTIKHLFESESLNILENINMNVK